VPGAGCREKALAISFFNRRERKEYRREKNKLKIKKEKSRKSEDESTL